uniref:26S proteasome non-ATPase regulatory subunit 2 homolog n=1 Tax=Tetradesmus obliquus TaxID=3088 RepID=A0A383WPA2_TETOB|eukprot:jgi/Sobl393_1/4638/SZX79265.1
MAVAKEEQKAAPDKQKQDGKKKQEPEEELSDEDLELKKNIELMVERVKDSDAAIVKAALDAITKEIHTTTSSMTAVPKPLKFLRPHLETLISTFEAMLAGPNRQTLADVLSLLTSTVAGKEGEREGLRFKLQGNTSDLETWGHEYMRHLAGEIAEEYKDRHEKEQPVDDLLHLVAQIVPYHMTHNAEPEAVDLLLEVDQLDKLEQHVDDKNYARTCLYLVSCCTYLPEPEDTQVLQLAHRVYMAQKKYHDALRVALRLNEPATIEATFAACSDVLERRQLGYLLARHGAWGAINLEEGPAAVEDEAEREALREIISNSKLSEHFLALARDLDVVEPKVPEDVYKSHLTDGRQPAGAALDSARQNLASTFVNAFVNAGYGQDKLVTVSTEGNDTVHWIFKNKDHGKTSATASLGLISLWDVEGGLPLIDKYLYSNDNAVVAGALLATGLVNCGVQNENDPAFALISDYVSNADAGIRSGAILGLGLAYAGTQREEVQELLVPLVLDSDQTMEVAGLAALALGLVFSSSCKEDVVEALLTALMSRGETELSGVWAKFLVLGLGLLFLGKQEVVEPTLEIAKTLAECVSKYAQVVLDGCAYAGSGNVLKVQELLALCGEHIETEEAAAWKAVHQGPAVLGIALIAMAEPLGAQMATRMLEHLLSYGEPPVRRCVPLALALLHVSDPAQQVVDALSRLSHDADTEAAQNAVLALGIVGAGTNNARLAGILRGLASYYYKEPSLLFLVRAAQGLAHMGKGLIGLSPIHTDKQLLSGVALSGLLAVLTACQDLKATIGAKHHYLLYCLATAMTPRMLLTVDNEGQLLSVPVRVGQAVDVVAQAGRPKTITGFQTHTTPVLMSAGERAELGSEKYLPLTPILEGTVILKTNPDYVELAE